MPYFAFLTDFTLQQNLSAIAELVVRLIMTVNLVTVCYIRIFNTRLHVLAPTFIGQQGEGHRWYTLFIGDAIGDASSE